MKKNLILKISIIFLIIITIIIILILIQKNNTTNKSDNLDYNYQELINSGITREDIKDLSKVQIDEKIINLKRKLSLKGLIEKGNNYVKQEEYTIALTKFIQILKEIPGDSETINKIADIYYELKKYDKAYNYYMQIKDYNNLDKQKAINSLIFSYTNNITKDTLKFINEEIDKYNLDNNQLFYYKNSFICLEDFSLCKKYFQDYFNKIETQSGIIEGTGTIESSGSFEKNENLENIKNAITNYYNFKLDDLSYKNALITGAYFSNGLYPIAIELSKQILIEKPNYKPILKIIAKSYYELGMYDEAKDFLIQYNKIDDSDAEISYFLGVIYQKLHDYVLSSIHLKKSIDLGYTNSIEATRRIIFNYSEVGETDKMLKSFEELILKYKDKIEIEDINLAIYFHIINSKLEIAKEINKYAIDNYKDNAIFYGYLGWINLEEIGKIEGALEIAEKNLNLAYEGNNHNSMINYLLGLLEIEKNNELKAIEYFKTTINLDEKGEFGIRSKNILETITNKEKGV